MEWPNKRLEEKALDNMFLNAFNLSTVDSSLVFGSWFEHHFWALCQNHVPVLLLCQNLAYTARLGLKLRQPTHIQHLLVVTRGFATLAAADGAENVSCSQI